MKATQLQDATVQPFAEVRAPTCLRLPQLPKLRAGPRMPRAMSDEEPLTCPQCGGRLTVGAMVLSKREEDGQRVCRVVSACDSRHIWWSGRMGSTVAWNRARTRRSSLADIRG